MNTFKNETQKGLTRTQTLIEEMIDIAESTTQYEGLVLPLQRALVEVSSLQSSDFGVDGVHIELSTTKAYQLIARVEPTDGLLQLHAAMLAGEPDIERKFNSFHNSPLVVEE